MDNRKSHPSYTTYKKNADLKSINDARSLMTKIKPPPSLIKPHLFFPLAKHTETIIMHHTLLRDTRENYPPQTNEALRY